MTPPTLLAFLATCLITASAAGDGQVTQSLTPGEIPVDSGTAPDRLTLIAAPPSRKWQLNIRRSFSSRSEEQKPASITAVTAGEGRNSYSVDLAAALYNKPATRFRFAPTVEWHRQSAQKRNRVSGGFAIDSLVLDRPSLNVAMRGEGNVIRNIARNTTTGKAAFSLSGFVPGPLANASVIRSDSGGAIKGTWYPWAGLEALHDQPFGDLDHASVTLLTLRAETRFFPFNRSATSIASPFEVAASYAYRRPFEHSGLRDHYGLISLEATLFLDAAHHIALGFDYENGTSPENDFVSGHTGVLALRFRL